MAEFFASDAWIEAVGVLKTVLLSDIAVTLYSTVIATVFAYVLGLPLGVLLVVGEPGNVRPISPTVMKVLNFAINILRSIPFLILMIMVVPLTRLLLGSSIGTPAMTFSLVVAAFPYVARLVEASLRETDRGVIEAAQSMGATPLQIICKVMLPESLPSLLSGATIALTTVMAYGAMAGAIGGTGLGNTAITYGYHRKRYIIMYVTVAVLVVLVQLFQSVGTRLTVMSDKRISKLSKRRINNED